MRFIAETHRRLKRKMHLGLHERVDVHSDENLLDAKITKFSYPRCFAARESSAKTVRHREQPM